MKRFFKNIGYSLNSIGRNYKFRETINGIEVYRREWVSHDICGDSYYLPWELCKNFDDKKEAIRWIEDNR